MSCPFAIAAVITYCSGSPEACNPGKPTGLHLFEATQDVVHFDTEEGARYEILLPASEDDRGAWHWDGIAPDAGTPEHRQAIDPFALAGYYRYGTYQAVPGESKAVLRRLAGSDRIGVCRIDTPDDIKAVSWLALPFSRSAYTIWNQPLDDTPTFPLPWLACFATCLALAWARDTKAMRKPIPQDVLVTVIKASTLTDVVAWLALGVVVLEDSMPNRSDGVVVSAVYFGFVLVAFFLRECHYMYMNSVWINVVLGFAALLTSVFYVTTVLLWVWAAVVFSAGRWERIDSEDQTSEVKSLLF